MLASFVNSLRLESETALPGHGDEALHGLFFETLCAHDPSCATTLHKSTGARPFSISGVLHEYPKRQGHMHIPANARMEFTSDSSPTS
jgi:hypothetical protein